MLNLLLYLYYCVSEGEGTLSFELGWNPGQLAGGQLAGGQLPGGQLAGDFCEG